MLNLWSALLLAILAGAGLVVQQALNANLRIALSSTVWAGFVSYFVGLVCMILFALAVRDPVPSAAVTGRLPWYIWTGGAFGALYIALATILVPRLGAATFVAVLVAGQMLASIAFDQLGWFGLAQRQLDLPRAVGVALLVGGVVLIRR